MKRSVIALLILLVASFSPALAQTDTPTPTLTPSPTTVPAMPVPTFDLIASPTPVSTNAAATLEPSSGLPLNEVYNYLATAYVTLHQAPEDVTAPGGVSILPDVQLGTLFGFVKWLFSPPTADALLGPFSGLMIHFVAYFLAVLFLTNIYLIVFVVRFLIRFVVWIYTQVTKLIP